MCTKRVMALTKYVAFEEKSHHWGVHLLQILLRLPHLLQCLQKKYISRATLVYQYLFDVIAVDLRGDYQSVLWERDMLHFRL